MAKLTDPGPKRGPGRPKGSEKVPYSGRIDPATLDRLGVEAAALGISRNELIERRLSGVGSESARQPPKAQVVEEPSAEPALPVVAPVRAEPKVERVYDERFVDPRVPSPPEEGGGPKMPWFSRWNAGTPAKRAVFRNSAQVSKLDLGGPPEVRPGDRLKGGGK